MEDFILNFCFYFENVGLEQYLLFPAIMIIYSIFFHFSMRLCCAILV